MTPVLTTGSFLFHWAKELFPVDSFDFAGIHISNAQVRGSVMLQIK